MEDSKFNANEQYKHSANMLFGSQFLREVYEDSSLSTVIDNKAGTRLQTMPDETKEMLTEMLMAKLGHEESLSSRVPPQARQAEMGRKAKLSHIDMTHSRHKINDTSTNRHQAELEQVIGQLSRFEGKDESISVVFGQSRILTETGTHAEPIETL